MSSSMSLPSTAAAVAVVVLLASSIIANRHGANGQVNFSTGWYNGKRSSSSSANIPMFPSSSSSSSASVADTDNGGVQPTMHQPSTMIGIDSIISRPSLASMTRQPDAVDVERTSNNKADAIIRSTTKSSTSSADDSRHPASIDNSRAAVHPHQEDQDADAAAAADGVDPDINIISHDRQSFISSIADGDGAAIDSRNGRRRLSPSSSSTSAADALPPIGSTARAVPFLIPIAHQHHSPDVDEYSYYRQHHTSDTAASPAADVDTHGQYHQVPSHHRQQPKSPPPSSPAASMSGTYRNIKNKLRMILGPYFVDDIPLISSSSSSSAAAQQAVDWNPAGSDNSDVNDDEELLATSATAADDGSQQLSNDNYVISSSNRNRNRNRNKRIPLGPDELIERLEASIMSSSGDGGASSSSTSAYAAANTNNEVDYECRLLSPTALNSIYRLLFREAEKMVQCGRVFGKRRRKRSSASSSHRQHLRPLIPAADSTISSVEASDELH